MSIFHKVSLEDFFEEVQYLNQRGILIMNCIGVNNINASCTYKPFKVKIANDFQSRLPNKILIFTMLNFIYAIATKLTKDRRNSLVF